MASDHLHPPVPASEAPDFNVDEDLIRRAHPIKLAIFDVDGVLTDGSLFLSDDGQEYKAFNSRDGQGIKMLARQGVDTAIITGRTSKVVEHRMRDLQVKHLYLSLSCLSDAGYAHISGFIDPRLDGEDRGKLYLDYLLQSTL